MYNFQNVAIKCDNWRQMEQLAEIARKQRLNVVLMERGCFPSMPYFRMNTISNNYSHHSHYQDSEIVISFDDFMQLNADKPEYSAYTQSVLTHLPTGEIQAFAASPDGEKILSDMYLPFEYSQDYLKVVAEMVMEAFEAQ